jgi:hypothetical protein
MDDGVFMQMIQAITRIQECASDIVGVRRPRRLVCDDVVKGATRHVGPHIPHLADEQTLTRTMT